MEIGGVKKVEDLFSKDHVIHEAIENRRVDPNRMIDFLSKKIRWFRKYGRARSYPAGDIIVYQDEEGLSIYPLSGVTNIASWDGRHRTSSDYYFFIMARKYLLEMTPKSEKTASSRRIMIDRFDRAMYVHDKQPRMRYIFDEDTTSLQVVLDDKIDETNIFFSASQAIIEKLRTDFPIVKDSDIDEFVEFCDFMLQDVEYYVVEAVDQDEAQLLYEDRGTGVVIIPSYDQCKNMLSRAMRESKTSEEQQKVKLKLWQLEHAMRNACFATGKDADDVMRYWVYAGCGTTTNAKNPENVVKKELETRSAEDILDDIVKFCDMYKKVLTSSINNPTERYMLRQIQREVYKIPILSLLIKGISLDKKQMDSKVVDLIRRMRGLSLSASITGTTGRAQEKDACQIANLILNDKISEAISLTEAFTARREPGFIDKVMSLEVASKTRRLKPLGKIMISVAAEHYDGGKYFYFDDEDAEHFLSVVANSEAKEIFTEEEYQSCITMIGTYLPLEKSVNRELQNKPRSEKFEKYMDEKSPFTKSIVVGTQEAHGSGKYEDVADRIPYKAHDVGGPSEIIDRTAWIAKLLYEEFFAVPARRK
jgi:hypothetical protein